MRRCSVWVAAVLLFFAACSKDDTNDQSAVPEQIQYMLVDTVGCICDPFVAKYKWQGEIVYVKGFSGPFCNWIPGYFDEEGKPLTMPQYTSLDVFKKDAVLVSTVWPCRDR